MTEPELDSQEQAEDNSFYIISFERLEELNRSGLVLVAERRGPSFPSREKPDNELSDVKVLVDEIAEHYAEDEEYIRTDMPIQEIVFRILLTRRNQPTPLRDLHYELTERWATPVRPINISELGLRRILDADTHYGFARVDDHS
ncbi:MAG: hypothetical protein BZY88_10355 [SAR202 cluster bacterium Io17-Chloro-G9]|nr:MAG: hypothetical protein BZY88_10355 [SAR202 cluster bacterium Io17-Chloro-G9]